MKKVLFTGLCTALITPLRGNSVDKETLKANIAAQSAAGVSAVLACGTTGEASTLHHDEKQAVVSAAVDAAAGLIPVIAGIGGNDTAEVCETAKDMGYLGVSAVLAVTPYYNKATQEGLYRHFSLIADVSPSPVIIYNIPSRSSVNVEPETYARLSKHENIIAVKEANPDMAAFQRSRSLCGDELHFYSGNDDTTVPMMACGAKGVISVASNIVPRAIASICSLALSGDFPAASTRYARYAELVKLLFAAPNPIPIKEAMKLMAIDSGEMRLPLCPADDALKRKIKAQLEQLDLI